MMIDADRLPLADLKAAKAEKPRTRMEQIQRMDVDELAKFINRIMDGDDRVGFCRNLQECTDALDKGYENTIPVEKCDACLKLWLMMEGEV